MSIGSFLGGLVLMVIGYFALRRTDFFLQYIGDISDIFGALNARWVSWKAFGAFLMILGFLIAFGLLQLFFNATIGQLFYFITGG